MCFLVSVMCSCLAAKEFSIVFRKPNKVGDKVQITGSGESSEDVTMTSEGKVMNETKKELRSSIDGTVEVLKVDEKKRPVKLKLKIEKLSSADKPGIPEIEVFPIGSEVIIEAKGRRTVFMFNGEVLPPETARILAMFISLPTGKVTDDDIFGTKEKKKVGDTWKLNKKEAAAGMSKDGMKFDENNIEGSTKLEKVVKVGDSEFLQLNTQLKVSNMKFPFPPGLETRKSGMTVKREFLQEIGDAPKSFDARWEKTSMTMEMSAEGSVNPQASPITIDVKVSQDVEKTIKNVK